MIDPRAESLDKLVPEDPLPYVSRRALKRVKNPLPVPKVCPYCNGPVALVENSAIYWGKSYGEWPYAFLCRPCDAYVGLHPDTDIPLGTLANKDLREDRKWAKSLFHKLMDERGWDRTAMYEWLAGEMKIPVGECHFGWFDNESCFKACYVLNNTKS